MALDTKLDRLSNGEIDELCPLKQIQYPDGSAAVLSPSERRPNTDPARNTLESSNPQFRQLGDSSSSLLVALLNLTTSMSKFASWPPPKLSVFPPPYFFCAHVCTAAITLLLLPFVGIGLFLLRRNFQRGGISKNLAGLARKMAEPAKGGGGNSGPMMGGGGGGVFPSIQRSPTGGLLSSILTRMLGGGRRWMELLGAFRRWVLL